MGASPSLPGAHFEDRIPLALDPSADARASDRTAHVNFQKDKGENQDWLLDKD